jgi:hypothetical protein
MSDYAHQGVLVGGVVVGVFHRWALGSVAGSRRLYSDKENR